MFNSIDGNFISTYSTLYNVYLGKYINIIDKI